MQPNRQVLLQRAVCVAVGLVLCVSSIADEVTISGTVLTPDGQPAAGARVIGAWRSFDDAGRHAWAETNSSGSGKFALRINCETTPHTEGTITALKDGFGMGCELIDISRTRDCVVRLNVSARLRGSVADSAGHPIAGARVELVSARVWPDEAPVRFAGQVAALSAEDGEFALDGLAGGCGYRVEVHCDGWTTIVADVPVLGDSETLDVVLCPDAVICGLVTRHGASIAGTPVGAERTDAPESGDGIGGTSVPVRVGTVTDADGFYLLEGLSAGVYNICAGADDGCDWTAVAHEGLRCLSGHRLEHQDFELVDGVLITGRVISATRREPVAGVVVHCQGPARPSSGAWSQSARTDEDGSYRFRVPPGVNAVWLERPLTGDTTGRHRMLISEGHAADRGEYWVTDTCLVDARVVDQNSDPVSGGVVEFQSSRGNGADIRQCKLNRHGRLRIVMDRQFVPQELLVRDADGSRAGLVGLTEDAKLLQVEMHPPCTLTGTVVAPSGEPLPGIDVSCQHEVVGEPLIYQRRLGQVSTTDEHGRFRIEGLTASTTVWVMIEGDARRYQLSSDWRKLVLQPSETRDIGTAVVNLSGLTLRGRTMDAERNLLGGCTVIDIHSQAHTRSDAGGVFELSGLPHSSWSPYLLAVDPQRLLFGVEPRADATLDMAVNMVLEPLASACGRLLAADGKPLSDCTVWLYLSGRPRCISRAIKEGEMMGARLESRIKTGQDGAWECDALIGGASYCVEARQGYGLPLWSQAFTPVPKATFDFGDVTVK